MSVLIGSNLGTQPVAGMSMQRWYNGWLNTMPYLNNGGVMPPDWPGGGHSSVLYCVSIQPPVQQLLNGSLDTDIRRFISAAPKGSMLGIWHEAEGQHYPGITASVKKEMDTRMLALTRGSNVSYGCFNCGALATNVTWDIKGLDFYGLDIYDAVSFEIGYAGMLDRFLWNVSSVQPNPMIAVTECNSHDSSRRPYAFATMYGWLRRHCWEPGFAERNTAMLTYWNPGGGLSGPWLPNDTATVQALQAIVTDAYDHVTE